MIAHLSGTLLYKAFDCIIVDVNDPNIGMFNATLFLHGSLDLFVVNLDGTNSGAIHATLDPSASHVHVPTPEPTSIAIFGIAALGLVAGRGRRRSQVSRS